MGEEAVFSGLPHQIRGDKLRPPINRSGGWGYPKQEEGEGTGEGEGSRKKGNPRIDREREKRAAMFFGRITCWLRAAAAASVSPFWAI